MNPILHSKYLTVLAIAFMLTACCRSRNEVNLDNIGEITVTCPEASQYLPDFPPFADRESFFNDSLMYRRTYALRSTERLTQAVTDARLDIDFYLERYGRAMGLQLSTEKAPAIARYLETTYMFARSGVLTAKTKFLRQRPYSYFDEQSAIPEDESTTEDFSSYPSGHSTRAWSIVMALVAIDDTHLSDIVKVGMEIGESRMIVGFHYASDVEYAKIAASIAFSKLVSDPEYMKLMGLARRELETLRKASIQ